MITSRFPFPLEKGDKLRAYHQIKKLSQHFDIHLISTPDRKVLEKHKNELEKYCKSIHIFQISLIQKLIGISYAFLTKKPFQVGYFYQFPIHKKINSIIHQLQPDHIYCQLIRSSEYVKNYHLCSKTIDYMDALSKGMERLANQNRGIRKFIYNREFKRLLEYENSIFEYFENHTIISKQDQQHIFHKHKDQIVVIPNGIDNSFLEDKRIIEKDCDLLFIGHMSYAPNITAAKFIVNKILPNLPDTIKLKIAGSSPAKEIQKLASNRVEVTGYVEDIKATYKSGKVFIAPMFLSVGLQNKLLEAMALGVPCITSSLANNALQAEPEEEILIAEHEEEFTLQIIRLLEKPELQQKLSNNAYEFVRKNHNWNKTIDKLVLLFDN